MNELFPVPRTPEQPRPRRRMIFNLFFVALALYIAAFLMLASMQRSFLYHPQRGTEQELLALAETRNLQPWRDSNNSLIGWKRVLDSPAQNRLLILHGNGGHALSRTYLMDGLGALDNGETWEFYTLEYPGYGSRDGEHSEATIVAAAEAALQLLVKDDARPVYLAGESLGSGVACLLAAKHPDKIRGLFLVTPFTSIVDVAQGQFPLFPVRLALRDTYEASRALRNYNGRVAVVLAGRDEMVPTHYGQKLFDDYKGVKKLWIQPDAGHNTLDYEPSAAWWKEVSDFLTD